MWRPTRKAIHYRVRRLSRSPVNNSAASLDQPTGSAISSKSVLNQSCLELYDIAVSLPGSIPINTAEKTLYEFCNCPANSVTLAVVSGLANARCILHQLVGPRSSTVPVLVRFDYRLASLASSWPKKTLCPIRKRSIK